MVTRFKLWFCFKGLLICISKNADSDKYVHCGYVVGFNSHEEFSLFDGSKGENVIIFGVDMSSSVHIDNKKKDMLIRSIGPTQESDDITLSAKAQYSINFS